MRNAATQQTLDTLGRAMRAARSEQGYSQQGFAAHVGLDSSYYGAIERGQFNVTLDTLLKIAEGLHMPAWALLKAGEQNA